MKKKKLGKLVTKPKTIVCPKCGSVFEEVWKEDRYGRRFNSSTFKKFSDNPCEACKIRHGDYAIRQKAP